MDMDMDTEIIIITVVAPLATFCAAMALLGIVCAYL